MTRGTPGLRELNKQRTREAISHAATRLFIERGFDSVTIADVAAEVGVAKMTVTNHFPLKEDLVLDIHEDLITGPARTVTQRAPGESALDALSRACLAALERCDPALGFSSPAFAGMITASPDLSARLREIHEQREEGLAAALAQETGAAGDDLTPRLAAVHLDGVHRVVFKGVVRRTLAGETNDSIAERLAEPTRASFDQLRPCLGRYAVRGSTQV
ncbi:TetR/AcrR family transcriptional regulator [Nocardiopsis gilva YIM 90087]|uniref:TetR/AcrR family transcriptional regulator n=1 Tax=Nocardiopsis gilva YIM 90087 TaxID=1235441 RepID=A0A223S7E3_9ACTN|nr:TetR/AcrR family transcriptional regulator [Nocardiopsis gilva]ASU84046.1 TetR/AcrR family transcriptional regulator [Nocardiopsis gilva YIM 90087]